MAVTDKNTLKDWFKNGLKPPQEQFWAWQDSYYHKFDLIPTTVIEGFEDYLNDKADKQAFDNHLTDTNAHITEFGAKEDKANKGEPNGYVPLDEFAKIAFQFLNIINDLTTGGVTALLSAEQGKVLQTQIDGIHTILESDDIDLDTLQEVVNFIKNVQEGLAELLVNDLTTGGVTKALTAEMGKVLAERVLALEVKPIPDDFYIATLFDSSKIMYKTDTYRELDLQPHVSVTVTMTNEIVRNGDDFFIVGNFTNDNSLPVFIVRLLGAKIHNNILIFDSIESGSLAAPIHGLIYHNDFLFTATRSSLTTITKINPYDFSDVRTLTLPNTSDYTGYTTDIIGYKNKLYILCTVDWFQDSKFIEISDDLVTYRKVFSIPSTSTYRTTSTSPFLIYNDELYVPFTIDGTNMALRVYDLQGNMRRERTNITINTTLSGGYYVTPHWMTIFNNKLILTSVYGKSLVRLDCLTLATEDSKALPTSITDDNSISRDGYLYLHGEINPFDLTASVQLLKVKYNNFSDYTVVLDGLSYNNGKGSHGSINYKVQPSGLNLLAKKDNYLSKTANYTIVLSDFPNDNTLVVYVNATSANVTITLPLAESTAGYEVKVIKTDATANTVTVKGNGSQLINAANTFVLSTQFSSVKTNSNGTQNYIL